MDDNCSNPLISVIIPVYNVEKYLEKCIESVLEQSYTNLDIILVDDGATDSSGMICDKYAQADNRIKVIHKKNGGLSDARNAGIEVARGVLISFLDSDDFLLNDFYEYAIGLMKKYDADMVATPLCSFAESGEILSASSDKSETLMTDKEAIHDMFSRSGIPWCAQAKLYRIELFKDIRFPVGVLMEDKATTYKIFAKCNRIVYARSYKYMYLIRQGSIMHAKFTERNLHTFDIQLTLNDFISNNYPATISRAHAYTGRVALATTMAMVAADFHDKKAISDRMSYALKYHKELMKSDIIDWHYKALSTIVKTFYGILGEKTISNTLFRKLCKIASTKIKSR